MTASAKAEQITAVIFTNKNAKLFFHFIAFVFCMLNIVIFSTLETQPIRIEILTVILSVACAPMAFASAIRTNDTSYAELQKAIEEVTDALTELELKIKNDKDS